MDPMVKLSVVQLAKSVAAKLGAIKPEELDKLTPQQWQAILALLLQLLPIIFGG